MEYRPLKQLFPDTQQICPAVLPMKPQARRTGLDDDVAWKGITTLSKMDDKAFRIVAVNHPMLPSCVQQLLTQCVSGRARVPTEQYEALCKTVLRLSVTLGEPAPIEAALPSRDARTGGKKTLVPTPSEVSSRLQALFPPDSVASVAFLLSRVSPLWSSVGVFSLCVQAPSTLLMLRSSGSQWCDRLIDAKTKLVAEAKIGRFQRRGGTTLAILEDVFSAVASFWAMVHAVPWLVEFFAPLPRIIEALRTVVNTCTPMLQYFVLSCDVLAPKRPHLVKALAKLTNYAVDASTIAIIFAQHCYSTRSDFANISRNVDELLSAHLSEHCPLTVKALMRQAVAKIDASTAASRKASTSSTSSSSFAVLSLLRDLVGSSTSSSYSVNVNVDRLYQSSLAELSDSKAPSTSYAEYVLKALKAQHITIDPADVVSGTEIPSTPTDDATQKDGGKKSTTKPQKHEDPIQQPVAAAATSSTASEEAASRMILDVMPHYNPTAVLDALKYYNNNPDEFLNDALTGNLPPHLADALEGRAAAVPVASTTPNTTSSTQPTSSSKPITINTTTAMASTDPDAPSRQITTPLTDASSGRTKSVAELLDDHHHHHPSKPKTTSRNNNQIGFAARDDEDDDSEGDEGPMGFRADSALFGTGGKRRQGGDGGDDDGEEEMMSSSSTGLLARGGDSTTEFFQLDDQLKDRIKELAQMAMYDDERDDGEDDAMIPIHKYQQQQPASSKRNTNKNSRLKDNDADDQAGASTAASVLKPLLDFDDNDAAYRQDDDDDNEDGEGGEGEGGRGPSSSAASHQRRGGIGAGGRNVDWNARKNSKPTSKPSYANKPKETADGSGTGAEGPKRGGGRKPKKLGTGAEGSTRKPTDKATARSKQENDAKRRRRHHLDA